ncbi:hypothetical protein CDAR_215961 [Caerostris darwini]|uniref:Mediator complex subunit 4 n=1 Tax=Caerostris darwini TaxID=1538125 RepID=A0AAV4NLF6_9ARAC|nr:hypothetical protein CDAR_215961 [Caerostris darwini]
MIDFAENVTTLLTVARTIEGIFAKNKSYHRPTKTAVQQEFLKLDTLFGHKEKIINQLRIEIDSLQQKEKEHNEKIEQLKEKDLQIAMLKGQLEESRNFNREILTDNLKAITEAINTTKQVQPAPTKSFAEAVKKQQTTVILAPKDKDQSVKDMRSNISDFRLLTIHQILPSNIPVFFPASSTQDPGNQRPQEWQHGGDERGTEIVSGMHGKEQQTCNSTEVDAKRPGNH